MRNIILLAVFMINSSFFMAQNDDSWVVLAKKDVSYKADKDIINLLGNNRDIRKIKLRCKQGSLKIKKIIFIYSSSDKEEHTPKGTGVLTKGTSSIPIKTEKKESVKKVEIHYEGYGNMLLTKRAKVEVLGLITKN